MLEGILSINIIVIIFPILGTRIIWRIYIDNVNLAFVRISKRNKSVEIISLNKNMVGRIYRVG